MNTQFVVYAIVALAPMLGVESLDTPRGPTIVDVPGRGKFYCFFLPIRQEYPFVWQPVNFLSRPVISVLGLFNCLKMPIIATYRTTRTTFRWYFCFR